MSSILIVASNPLSRCTPCSGVLFVSAAVRRCCPLEHVNYLRYAASHPHYAPISMGTEVAVSHREKRGARYRARFTDPTGAKHSCTFTRKADAQRFLRELDAAMLRGSWVDPRDADMAVANWAEEFLSLCRRLAERT